MVDLMLVDLGYLDSCIVIAPLNVKFDTPALFDYDTLLYHIEHLTTFNILRLILKKLVLLILR